MHGSGRRTVIIVEDYLQENEESKSRRSLLRGERTV
jgi:hypothetical protein